MHVAVHVFNPWCSISKVRLITRLSNVLNLQVSNKLVQPRNIIMYCSSEVAKSYSRATRQIYMRNLTHMQNLMYVCTNSNSRAEHRKSNSCVVLNSDSSAAQDV